MKKVREQTIYRVDLTEFLLDLGLSPTSTISQVLVFTPPGQPGYVLVTEEREIE